MKPRVLIIAPTRDGYKNPSRRLADKHIRLFHGRTLDEWFCIRAWSSECMTDFCLVTETEEHTERIRPMVEKYAGQLVCRPEVLLHPMEDTGGKPLRWGLHKIIEKNGPYNLVIQNFVVNPVLPPGLFDRAVKRFLELVPNLEDLKGPANMVPACYPIESFTEEREDGRLYWSGPRIMNTSKGTTRWKSTMGWTVSTPEFNDLAWMLSYSGLVLRAADLFDGNLKFEVPVWTDMHIDTEDEWDLAEWYFGKYIGIGNKAFEAYDAYRRTWCLT